MRGYVARKGDRWYAVVYEGLDPVTGKEKRTWHPAGTSQEEAEQLAARLAAELNGRNDKVRSLTFGAAVGRDEGYHWGGGCWDSDNVDDQPGDPVQNEGTHGEGGDCSGFTFKSWGLKNSETTSGYHYWPRMRRIHGPPTASEFKAGVGLDVNTVAKSPAIYMDAFASSSHIGMIYSTTSTANTDNIIEAKSEADGTGQWPRTYRGSSSYGGVRRGGGCGAVGMVLVVE